MYSLAQKELFKMKRFSLSNILLFSSRMTFIKVIEDYTMFDIRLSNKTYEPVLVIQTLKPIRS